MYELVVARLKRRELSPLDLVDAPTKHALQAAIRQVEAAGASIREVAFPSQAAQVTGVLTALGARGGPSAKPGTHFVYAYKLSPHTRP